MIVYIHPHLSLGDTLITCGLIRKIVTSNPALEFRLFCMDHYKQSVHQMYRDLPNVKMMIVPSFNPDDIIRQYAKDNNLGRVLLRTGYKVDQITDLVKNESIDQYMQIGIDMFHNRDTFERVWYDQFELDFKNKYSSFFYNKNETRENELYDKLVGIETRYLVVHEDSRYKINPKFVDKGLHIVYIHPKHTDNIFDYTKILENAEEIHCIESFLMFLVDISNIKTNKLVNHRYARQYSPFCFPSLRKDWNILNPHDNI